MRTLSTAPINVYDAVIACRLSSLRLPGHRAQHVRACKRPAIPSAIGVSPLLTITALAERTMLLAAEQLQRKLDVSTTPFRPVRDAAM
jgi:hypothetical protein